MKKPVGDRHENSRVAEIRRRIEIALQPQSLEIIDESSLHAGHEGAKDGRGHFRIAIAADALKGESRISQQRKVYEALGDMMQSDIHAVSIQVISQTQSSPE